MAVSYWLDLIICKVVILFLNLFFFLIATLLYRIWPQSFSVACFYVKLVFCFFLTLERSMALITFSKFIVLSLSCCFQ